MSDFKTCPACHCVPLAVQVGFEGSESFMSLLDEMAFKKISGNFFRSQLIHPKVDASNSFTL